MSGRLRRGAAMWRIIIWTLALILAVRVLNAARHPLRYARYLAARVFRRIPRRDPDGEPLDRGEMRAFITVVHSWKHPAPPERSRT